jgi:RNA polymerase sigma-70 factor, ECF subfamily
VSQHFRSTFAAWVHSKDVSQVVRLPTPSSPATDASKEDDTRLLRGLREREPWAAAVIVDRYINHVRHVLVRVMGVGEHEIDDLVQEVFTRALAGAHRLSFGGALKSWLTSIAIFTGRETIRRRSRWRWLHFTADPPDCEAPHASPEISEAAHVVYAMLDQLPVNERIVFALHAIDGMAAHEVAAACGVSVPTVRRRLARAERRFHALAARHEALSAWVRQ